MFYNIKIGRKFREIPPIFREFPAKTALTGFWWQKNLAFLSLQKESD